MIRCPKCSTENTDAAPFCTRCHQTLIFRCPSCWHEQRATGICEKCGINMTAMWTREFAIARANQVKERAEEDPIFKPGAPAPTMRDLTEYVQAIPHERVPLLKFIGGFVLRCVSIFGLPRID